MMMGALDGLISVASVMLGVGGGTADLNSMVSLPKLGLLSHAHIVRNGLNRPSMPPRFPKGRLISLLLHTETRRPSRLDRRRTVHVPR